MGITPSDHVPTVTPIDPSTGQPTGPTVSPWHEEIDAAMDGLGIPEESQETIRVAADSVIEAFTIPMGSLRKDIIDQLVQDPASFFARHLYDWMVPNSATLGTLDPYGHPYHNEREARLPQGVVRGIENRGNNASRQYARDHPDATAAEIANAGHNAMAEESSRHGINIPRDIYPPDYQFSRPQDDPRNSIDAGHTILSAGFTVGAHGIIGPVGPLGAVGAVLGTRPGVTDPPGGTRGGVTGSEVLITTGSGASAPLSSVLENAIRILMRGGQLNIAQQSALSAVFSVLTPAQRVTLINGMAPPIRITDASGGHGTGAGAAQYRHNPLADIISRAVTTAESTTRVMNNIVSRLSQGLPLNTRQQALFDSMSGPQQIVVRQTANTVRVNERKVTVINNAVNRLEGGHGLTAAQQRVFGTLTREQQTALLSRGLMPDGPPRGAPNLLTNTIARLVAGQPLNARQTAFVAGLTPAQRATLNIPVVAAQRPGARSTDNLKRAGITDPERAVARLRAAGVTAPGRLLLQAAQSGLRHPVQALIDAARKKPGAGLPVLRAAGIEHPQQVIARLRAAGVRDPGQALLRAVLAGSAHPYRDALRASGVTTTAAPTTVAARSTAIIRQAGVTNPDKAVARLNNAGITRPGQLLLAAAKAGVKNPVKAIIAAVKAHPRGMANLVKAGVKNPEQAMARLVAAGVKNPGQALLAAARTGTKNPVQAILRTPTRAIVPPPRDRTKPTPTLSSALTTAQKQVMTNAAARIAAGKKPNAKQQALLNQVARKPTVVPPRVPPRVPQAQIAATRTTNLYQRQPAAAVAPKPSVRAVKAAIAAARPAAAAPSPYKPKPAVIVAKPAARVSQALTTARVVTPQKAPAARVVAKPAVAPRAATIVAAARPAPKPAPKIVKVVAKPIVQTYKGVTAAQQKVLDNAAARVAAGKKPNAKQAALQKQLEAAARMAATLKAATLKKKQADAKKKR